MRTAHDPAEAKERGRRCRCHPHHRRFRATEAKTRSNDAKAMRARMDAMTRGEDDGVFDE
jgi:hypothetical protein